MGKSVLGGRKHAQNNKIQCNQYFFIAFLYLVFLIKQLKNKLTAQARNNPTDKPVAPKPSNSTMADNQQVNPMISKWGKSWVGVVR